MIVSAFNNRVRFRLGSKAPITIFTGLPRQSALGFMKATINEELVLKSMEDVAGQQLKQVQSLVRCMDEIHKTAKKKADDERERKVNVWNNRTGTRSVNFDVGDYVLRGLLKKESTKKLSVNWTGPFQVTRCMS